jgi:multimeric flavodoxin WrbA
MPPAAAEPRLLIIWHSRTGAAEAMARAAAEGAGKAAALVPAAEAAPETLLAADGYLFVCPENLATMSGLMKEMFDRAYYPLLGRIEGRP